MDIKSIKSLTELRDLTGKSERTFLLLVKGGTEKSDCALSALAELKPEDIKGIDFLMADVNYTRDIHPEYNIDSVPSLLEFRKGGFIKLYKGCNSREFYISAINGSSVVQKEGEGKKQKRITVYSTPSCTWCNTLKNYLNEKKVQYRDIDVSADQKAAEQMVNKSGQQGVPQTDIDGQIIIGFDKHRIDKLLGIK